MNIKKFINIPINLISQKGDIINILSEIHLVDNLSVSFIIGNNIWVLYKIDIVYNSPAETPALKINNKFIIIYNFYF